MRYLEPLMCIIYVSGVIVHYNLLMSTNIMVIDIFKVEAYLQITTKKFGENLDNICAYYMT